MRGTLIRILSAVVGIPIVVALVFWPGAVPFDVLIAIAAVIGMLEFYNGTKKHGASPYITLGLAAGILILLFGWRHSLPGSANSSRGSFIMPIMTGLVLLTLFLEVLNKHRAPLRNVGTTLLGVAYVPVLLLHFIWLRAATGSNLPASIGASLVMFVLVTSWAIDTGAFFVGKSLGKHKLAPDLSPGKTWEGSIGGFALGVIVATITSTIIGLPQPHGLILGAIISVFGQIGDLVESAMKREIGIKDFGALIPGHGGVLDRLDSLLFTAPIVYWYLVVFVSGWAHL